MPELPEVETIRRGVAPYLDNRTIKTLTINRNDLRVPIPENTRQIIQGQKVIGLDRHGKYILVALGNDQTIIWHMGMSGTVRIYKNQNPDPDQNPETGLESKKHDHVIMESCQGDVIVYNDPRRFGMFYTMPTAQISAQRPFVDMGADALAVTAESFFSLLQSRKSPIKTVLLDQAVVAGLGNIYVCEALFYTGISPQRAACDVTKAETEALVKNFKKILALSIEKGGSSLKDHRMTDGSMGYFQNFFHVYGKKGLPCPDCTCDPEQTGGIAQIKQAGRSTFYCPQKQA